MYFSVYSVERNGLECLVINDYTTYQEPAMLKMAKRIEDIHAGDKDVALKRAQPSSTSSSSSFGMSFPFSNSKVKARLYYYDAVYCNPTKNCCWFWRRRKGI